MADTANEKLHDLLVRHQIYLSQYATGLYRKIAGLLSKADSELVEKILTKTDGTFTKTRLEAMLVAVRSLNKQAVERMTAAMTGDLEALAVAEADWTKEAIQDVVPIKLDVIVPPKHTLKAAVTTDPIAGSLLKETAQDWGRQREKGVREAIRMGVVQGETIDQITRRVRGTKALNYSDGVLAVSRRSAEAIVRTGVQAVANSARDSLYQENDDLIKGVKWVSTLDARTTTICRARDGKVFPVDSGPRPPAHWNCRSTTTPVLKSWKDLGIDAEDAPPGTRASMDGQVPADLTYPEWLKRQPREFVLDVMGQRKGALFLDGNLPMDRFVDQTGRELTLEQLQQKERSAWSRAFGSGGK